MSTRFNGTLVAAGMQDRAWVMLDAAQLGPSLHGAAQLTASDPDAGRVKFRTHQPARRFWEAA